MQRRCAHTVFLLGLVLAAGRAGAERVVLTFLGDIMAHSVNFRAADFPAIYRPVCPLLQRDALTFANLETPVDSSREYSSYPRFNVALPYLRAAVEAGIDVFSLANNHAYDQGFAGIAATLRSLEEAGRGAYRRILYAGTRTDPAEPFHTAEATVRGLRIGFLAATQALNERMPEPWVLRVDYDEEAAADAFVERMRVEAARYDLFVLSYHGGREYAREPERAKVRFFRRLVEAGVDIVWGHHPHVVQGYALVERPEGRGLALYSAGNFISGMTWGIDPEAPEAERAWTGDSALWVVSVACAPGRAAVEEVWPVPITNVRDPAGTMVVSTFPGLAGPAGQELAEPWIGYFQERSRQLGARLWEWEQEAVDPR